MVTNQHTDQVLAVGRVEPPIANQARYAAGVAPAPRKPARIENEAPATVATDDTMIAGEVLFPGSSLSSASREFAAFMRRDGILSIQRRRDHAPVWQAGIGGNSGAFLEMLDDGDLCVSTLTGTKAWSSGTRGKPGAFAQMRNDGVLVVYSFYREQVWSTERP